MKNKKLEINLSGQIKHAECLEDIICLSVMINNGMLPVDATIDHSKLIFDNLPSGCDDCQFANRCLAYKINE